MLSRWLSFVVWALVGGTAMVWLLAISARPSAVPAHAVAVDTTPSLRGDLSRLMGADPPPVEQAEPVAVTDARFKLIGVVAARPGSEQGSIALIAVDGKPPRAFKLGATVDGDLVLKAVRARGAELGPSGGAVAVMLDLPPLAPAATGTLPPAGTPSAGAVTPVPQRAAPPSVGATGSEPPPMPTVAPQPVTPTPPPAGD